MNLYLTKIKIEKKVEAKYILNINEIEKDFTYVRTAVTLLKGSPRKLVFFSRFLDALASLGVTLSVIVSDKLLCSSQPW